MVGDLKLQIKKGTTSKLVHVFIGNSSVTTGAGLTGLVFNTASLAAYYLREGANNEVAIPLVTATLGSWTSGGFIEVDATNMPGLYELSIPDAALATGANSVTIMLKGAANMRPVCFTIQLTDVDFHEGVRGGMTALPNAAAEAAGGLITRGTGAGQLEVTSGRPQITTAQEDVLVDKIWDELLTTGAHNTANSAGRRLRELSSRIVRADTAQAGGATTITLDASASATDRLYVGARIALIGGTGVGQERTILEYVGATKVATVDRAWLTNPDATSEFLILSSPTPLTLHEGNAQAGAANTITLAATAAAVNDLYNGQTVVVRSGTGAGQARVITDYDGTTKVATVAEAWATNPASGSAYVILHGGRGFLVGGAAASVTAAMIATGAVDSDALAASALAAIADAVLDEVLSGHVAAGSLGERLQSVRANTAQAGGAATITLDAGASAVNDEYNYDLIYLSAGTGAGQARFISDYVGATKVATVAPGWTTQPDNTTRFVIIPFGQVAGATAPTAAEIWGHGSRTLTQSAGQVAAAVQGSVITLQRGDSISLSLTDLGDITGNSKLWFGVKSSLSAADAASQLLVERTAGLLYVNGAAAISAGNGTITVDDAASGDITIAIQEAETVNLVAGTYTYEVQVLNAGSVTTLVRGTCTIEEDVVRAVA